MIKNNNKNEKILSLREFFSNNSEVLEHREKTKSVLLDYFKGNVSKVNKLMKGYDYGITSIVRDCIVNMQDKMSFINNLITREFLREEIAYEIYYYWGCLLRKETSCFLGDIYITDERHWEYDFDDDCNHYEAKIICSLTNVFTESELKNVKEIHFCIVDELSELQGETIYDDSSIYKVNVDGNRLSFYSFFDKYRINARCKHIDKKNVQNKNTVLVSFDENDEVFSNWYKNRLEELSKSIFCIFHNLEYIYGTDNLVVPMHQFRYVFRYLWKLKKVELSLINLDEFDYDWLEKETGISKNKFINTAHSLEFAFENCKSMKELFFERTNLIEVSNFHGTFRSCLRLENIILDGFDTSKVTDMALMFCECENLKELDVSGFNTSNVTDMRGMFCGCESLKELDVSRFDTSKVTDMAGMFCGCKSLKELDVSGFDTSKVTCMAFMFADCNSLKELDVSGFDTSKVTDMKYMFTNCNSLKELDVSGFDTSKVTDMAYMFSGCEKIEELDLRCFEFENVTSMIAMFSGCLNLKTLNLGDSYISKKTRDNMSGIFNDCNPKLKIYYKNKLYDPQSFITLAKN